MTEDQQKIEESDQPAPELSKSNIKEQLEESVGMWNPWFYTIIFNISHLCIDQSHEQITEKIDNSQIAEIENSIDEKDHKTLQSQNVLSDTDANIETEVEKNSKNR